MEEITLVFQRWDFINVRGILNVRPTLVCKLLEGCYMGDYMRENLGDY